MGVDLIIYSSNNSKCERCFKHLRPNNNCHDHLNDEECIRITSNAVPYWPEYQPVKEFLIEYLNFVKNAIECDDDTYYMGEILKVLCQNNFDDRFVCVC